MGRFRFITVLALSGALLTLSLPINLLARDGLYAPSRPDDEALVRVVNVSDSAMSRTVDAGPVRFHPKDPGVTGPYRPVSPGVYLLGDPAGTVLTPERQSFVTIIVGHDAESPGAVSVFRDEAHDDPARAQLVLYNLTTQPVELVVAPSETVVFDDVAPESSRAIAVNAVSVDLIVRHRASRESRSRHDQAVSLSLSRGASVSLFAVEDESGFRVMTGDATVQID